MGKFFPGQGYQGQGLGDSLPENGKNRGQRPAEGPIPEDPAAGHGHQIPQPQIPGADAKAHIHPACAARQHEQGVGGGVSPSAQGPQNFVGQPQQRPGKQAHSQPPGGHGGGHPSSLRQNGSGRGSS